MTTHRNRRTDILALLALLFLPAVCAADEPFAKAVAPFVQTHCVGCHGPDLQEAGVRLDQLDGVKADNRTLWTMVHGKIASGEMPPKANPRPAEADRVAVTEWIAAAQRALGATSTRRLNRRELTAALRDVTGSAVNFAYSLPGDGAVAGFDTGTDGLLEASDAVAQWLTVTRRAVDGLRFLDADNGKVFDADLTKGKDPKKAMDGWKAAGASGKFSGIARPGVGLLIEPRSPGDREEFSVTVPTPADKQGVLRLTLDVSVLRPLPNLPNPRLWVRIGGQDLDFRELTTSDKTERLVYEVQLGDLVVQAKGVTVSLSNRIEIPYAVDGFENEARENPKDPIPGGPGLYRPAFDRKALPPEKQPAPHVILKGIRIEPEFVAAWPPAEWKAGLGGLKDDAESAKKLLALWADRAWRRPSTEAELAPFLKLYEKLRADGMAFDPALRATFQSVLMSPQFRYLAANSHTDAAVAQYAIASRLSFLLVGEPPDAELRRLAADAKLRDPAILDAQVDRLLADPRSDAFLRPFVTQWLVMDQPITVAQTHLNKQDFRFGRYLKASLKEETIQYVTELLRRNRPAKEIVSSDWTMMNDTLARHYGYPALDGGHLRQVTLKADDPRGGGVLGHAGIQSMLCWMGDNWVIYRGAWALRHVLDMPPPPPPLEVPELNPSEGRNRGKTFRQLLVQHQEDKKCAVCHKNIDPVGFAFQNFDLSGRWRDVEHETYKRGELDGRIAWVGEGKTRPVDATGRLPRGEEFKTFPEFKAALVKHYQPDLVRGLMKNLVVYSTGRVPNIDDLAEIAAIMKTQADNGYPLRDLLKSLIRSRVFLETLPPGR